RVRFQVYNDGGVAEDWQPQLEWSAASGANYTAVPTTSGADPFFVADTTQFTNGDTISTADFGCGTGTGTSTNGKAYDTENPASSNITLTNGYYTEIEFNIQANDNASYDTNYYFRLTDNGTVFDAYDVTEAVITIESEPIEAPGTLKQAHYRIGNDKSLSAMTWKQGVDQTAINILRNTNFRVRFQVYNDSTTGSWKPQLESSDTSDSEYAAVPTTSGANLFFVADTTQFTNGDAISTADFGCGSGNGTAQSGVAYDTENPPASAISLTNGYYTEIEFNIQANEYASYDTNYYFRLTDNGTAFDAYDVTEAVIKIHPQPSASDPHNTYLSTTDKCASCHRAHVNSGPRLRQETSEEDVCFSCHDGTGATTDISSTSNKTYNHPVAFKSWIHQPSESAAAAFSGSNRHVECEDCHKPHSRWPGDHALGNNAISPVIGGASGLSVSNGAAWTTPTPTFESSASYEYELCFKCHTSWSDATSRSYPSYPTENLTDQGVEFNPANRSHHAVEASGNNQSTNANYLQTFVSPITPSSTIYCSDCHGSETTTDPAGPHGSTNKSLLAGSTDDATIVCYKCHRSDVYGTSPSSPSLSRASHPINSQHTDGADNVWGIFCLNCHGGATAGGIHGTHAGVGSGGTAPLGEHFMNGAAMTGFTAGTGGSGNSGRCWTKSGTDSVNSCTKGHNGTTGSAFTPNYNY
ncbi:cytochrome c3 family protein, partial [Chloroflexota bacterium]